MTVGRAIESTLVDVTRDQMVEKTAAWTTVKGLLSWTFVLTS